MRVALCLSGQMRGFEKAYDSLKKNIIDILHPDVFIHTWEDVGMSNNIHRRTLPQPIEHYLIKDDKQSLDKFIKTFPNYINKLNNKDRITDERLKTLYSPKKYVIEKSPEKENYDNFFNVHVPSSLFEKEPKSMWSRQLFYKIQQCNELKKLAEVEGAFKYDLVIRLRPDLSIGEPIALDFLPNTLYYRIRTIDPSYQIADQFFYGDTETMDKACSLFNNLNDIWNGYINSNNHFKYYWAEGLFFTYIKKYHPDIILHSYRTEGSDKSSKYQLLDSFKRLKYTEVKNELFIDILSINDETKKLKYTKALSHALSNYAKNIEKDIIFALSKEFEEKLNHEPFYTLSQYYYKTNDYVKAIEYAKKAFKERKKSDEILEYIGIIYYEQGNYFNAKAYLTKAIWIGDEFNRENHSSKWRLFRLLGYTEENLGNYKDAYFHFLASLSFNDNDAPSYYRAGKMLFIMNRVQESMYYLLECLKINPEHDGAAYFLALVYYRLGMFQNGSAVCNKWLVNFKNNSIKFLPIMGMITYSRNHTDEALNFFKKYFEYKTSHKEIVIDVIVILIKLNQKDMINDFKKISVERYPEFTKEINRLLKGY